jgi:sugar/nucleoside kinase (ribokinase family)
VTSSSVDVVGVGNAIVDVITKTTDEFVSGQGLVKGSMNLIDDARAHELYALLGDALETSGGSVANSMAGIASFGGSAAFIGKVADDQLGAVYGDDMRSIGVKFSAPVVKLADGPATARSMILVTPDAQRTMNTYLGISNLLEPKDVSESLVSTSKIFLCEGFIWDVY